jgi:short-subunit dehydrogenase
MAKIASYRGLGCLVTGASSGIGREIARLLADDGARLVLVARRADRLAEVAEECRRRGAPDAHALAADLGRKDEVERVAAEGERLLGAVDVLVNNAGFAVPGRFVTSKVDRTLEMVRVNVDAAVLLTRRLLPKMVERDRGGVLTVSSVAGFQAAPYQTAYAGTKAFLLVWSDGLHQEVKHTKVAITALCPGVTDTEFFEAAGYPSPGAFLKLRADATRVARAGLRGLRRGTMDVVPGPLNKTLVWIQRLFTRRFAASVSRRLMASRPSPRSGPPAKDPNP